MPNIYGKPDAENPEWTREDFKRAKPGEEVFPEAFAPPKQRRGRGPQKALRLSRDVVTAYKRTGPGWQARVDEALKAGLKTRSRSTPAPRSKARPSKLGK